MAPCFRLLASMAFLGVVTLVLYSRVQGLGAECHDAAMDVSPAGVITIHCNGTCPPGATCVGYTVAVGGSTTYSCACDPTPNPAGGSNYSGDEYSMAGGYDCHFRLVVGPGGGAGQVVCSRVDCPGQCRVRSYPCAPPGTMRWTCACE